MYRKKTWLIIAIFLLSVNVKNFANEVKVKEFAYTPDVEPNKAYWIFSGIANNENGDQLGYFFQMEKQDNLFQVKSAVIGGPTKKTIFSYEHREIIPVATINNWKIGDAFLRFNPINHSWIFGVKTADKIGFNFKVDMFNQPIVRNEIQTLRPGLEALVHQTSRLNGHLKADKNASEQFVTANNAWFSKVWLSAQQDSTHELKSSFCRFNDSSGFYAQSLPEFDAKRANIAGWRDALGNTIKMSQFVNPTSNDNKNWKIDLALPKLEINLINQLENNLAAQNLVAGFFQDTVNGFCFFTSQKFVV